jgi:hypothetical protein
VSGQKQHTNTQATSHSQQSADEAGLPSVAIANNYSCGRDEHDRGDNPHGWHKLLTWPAGITAWAIMLTLAAIVWQSTETRRSASASKQAAEAALLSARALVNIERPWLVINARAYGHQRFYFEATNQGKSPAEIVTVAFDWKVSKEISERDETRITRACYFPAEILISALLVTLAISCPCDPMRGRSSRVPNCL